MDILEAVPISCWSLEKVLEYHFTRTEQQKLLFEEEKVYELYIFGSPLDP